MFIIGISGGTGSGKTTVVNQIINQIPKTEICIISQDAYYKETSHLNHEERTKINFDNPKAIDFNLVVKHLKKLKEGHTINQPVYSFITHNRTKDFIKIAPTKVVIVEGILIFNNLELLKLFDLKIFVDTDTDERLIRRIRRDISERGRTVSDVLDCYQNTLKPMHQKFVAPTKKYADFIIPNNKVNTVAIDIIKTIISERL